MDEIERYRHTLHATLPAFARKVEWSKQIIEDAYEKTQEDFYLAFSGGVDSTVLLDMLLEQQRIETKHILWGDDGWDYPETLNFLKATQERYFFWVRRIRCMQPWHDWCVEMGRPDLAHDHGDAWGNPHQWDATWQSLKDASQHGYGGVFLGLLAHESRNRFYALKGGMRPLYQVKSEHGMWHCSPLAAWDKRDVWAYVVSRNLPYNPVYDRLAELGVPLEQRRIAPLTCFRTVQYGSVVALRSGWPELYNRLAATFPKVREYT